jgi:putative intracellular protease/amidase
MTGRAYLVGSGQDGVLSQVAGRALRDVGRSKPRVAVTYAPIRGSAGGMRFMSQQMPRLFPGAVIEAIEGDPAVVARADIIFVSGGDPTEGAKVLERTGVGQWIRDAAARGVSVMGVSAGAILLGEWWADWPADDDPELERTDLVPCLRTVAGHVFDTHDEEDGWQELRTVAELLRRRGQDSCLLGIPTGGALVFDGTGGMEVVGSPPFRLR